MDVSRNEESENETIEDEKRQDEEAQKIRKVYRDIREKLNGKKCHAKFNLFITD